MSKVGNFYNRFGTIVVLLILILIVTSINPKFLEFNNILNVFRQVSINGLIALGMTFVILTAGIDLSVGAILGFSGVILGIMITNGVPDFFAVFAILIIGGLLGMFNGLLISKVKLQAFIVTLATMTMFRGLTLIVSDGIPIMNITNDAPFLDYLSQGTFMTLPVPMLILLFAFAILYILLQKTAFGRSVYAIGGNENVAKLSSIPTIKVKTYVYIISGIMSALAGVLLTSRLSSAQPTAGMTFELDAIAAVVIGGTSLLGGRGRITGTLIGVLIIGILNNGLNIIGVSAFYQQFIKGLVIIIAVILDRKNSN